MSGGASAHVLAESRKRLPPGAFREHRSRLPASWRQFALCLGADPDLWIPIEQDGGIEAVAICWACPVRTDCLAWAEQGISTDEEFAAQKAKLLARHLRRASAFQRAGDIERVPRSAWEQLNRPIT